MKDGYVYPKGIARFFRQHGYSVRYRRGNLNALKNEVAQGFQVIVLIHVRADRNWLHYVPVVGYDEDCIYLAESLPYLVNADQTTWNRKLPVHEFKQLWNTSELKMPLYAYTYFSFSSS